MSPSLTLPELLHHRASNDNETAINYLRIQDDHCHLYSSISHSELLLQATHLAARLLASGLVPKHSVVLASFGDHESHIRLFWACVLSGIIFCPLPPLHPDKSRQKLLFDHLSSLYPDTVLLTDDATVSSVKDIAPQLRATTLNALPEARVSYEEKLYPSSRPSPQDIVCFMLTSGSTGNSKAVSLTHANLLSSIRGKIKHHSSGGHNSRFFNWIAFDHVACVSEVHLQAMEAGGSQWHISPSAIIARPFRLLEISAAFKITYTFSPNFLIGHILRELNRETLPSCDLSSLRALISGGEAVPMATAVAFADLLEKMGAPRDTLRAGFGMSETGAGCIYDTRPIPRDSSKGGYLSLGKPCQGVSMRVVAPASPSVALPPSQSGFLQISGPTVFKSYFNNSSATSSSFHEEWFITGDLALIDEDGNLNLVGRDKDCLNINGVKYVPMDIVKYIEDSNLDGVVPGNVFVCPMREEGADTETYVVFYEHTVPVGDELSELQKSQIRITNRAITTLCTVFVSSVPHIVLPLPSKYFIKTSLGKVSSTALVKAYQTGELVSVQQSLLSSCPPSPSTSALSPTDLITPVEKTVQSCIGRVFALSGADESSLRRNWDLFAMGASSMHLFRLKRSIEDELGLDDVPTIEMLKRPLIGELCDYLLTLVTHKDAPRDVLYDPIVKFLSPSHLFTSAPKPPLFLIHPGVGEVLVFVNLAKALQNDNRPVYALRAKGFDYSDEPFSTFSEMVDTYVTAIERECPDGPYYLAGYSFGGVVAFEIAKVLETQRGKAVHFVGLLNIPPHIKWRMEELVWVEVLLNIGMFLSLFPEDQLGAMRQGLIEEFPRVSRDFKGARPIGMEEEVIQWVWGRSDEKRVKELDLRLDAFIRWVQVAYCINATGRTYDPQGILRGAQVTVFCATPLPSMGTREEFKTQRLSAWKEHTGDKFEMVDVSGAHYTMLDDDHVISFAEHLRGALARAEAASSRSD